MFSQVIFDAGKLLAIAKELAFQNFFTPGLWAGLLAYDQFLCKTIEVQIQLF